MEVFKKKNSLFSSVRAVYVHVPFCRRRCRYCDFYSTVYCPGNVEGYLGAVRGELTQRLKGENVTASSIFLGGGTPTVIGAKGLETLLQMLSPLAATDCEWTVEANPCTVDETVAEALAAGGVNRVTLGAQSFCDGELELLGRLHTAEQIGRAASMLRRSGLENLGLDLMYGLPHQTMASWEKSLDAALTLNPSHVSCYALSVEPGTPLAADVDAGRLSAGEETLQREMYEYACRRLAEAGLRRYELSNFAAPSRECRRNLTYWRNESYLGVGPAAAGYLQGRRYVNVADLEEYQRRVKRGQSPEASSEMLTGSAAAAEGMMLGLRLADGIDEQAFASRYGQRPENLASKAIQRYMDMGFLERLGGRLRLTDKALFVCDGILADILQEADWTERGD